MAVRNIGAGEVTCDGCGKIVVQATDAEPVDGYYGEVRQVAAWGGTAEHSFYACRQECIENAIVRLLAEPTE